MAIRNKDGSIYKLRGPNPLLVEQADWDKSQVHLINMDWKSEVVEDKKNPIKEMREGVIDIGEELNLEENPKPEVKTKAVPAKKFIEDVNAPAKKTLQSRPIKADEVIIEVSPKLARILKERSVEYYCAPAVGVKTHNDDLYDSTYKTTIYGEKFIFDAVIIAASDFRLQFWCVKHVNKDSIVYRKDKEGGERWWRISNVEARSDGFLVVADISDLNPDFS